MQVGDIKTREPFEALFPVSAETLNAVARHIETNGYDEAHPVIMWKEGNCVIDGHTRVLAAQSVGIEEVPVVWHAFDSEHDAVLYAIHCQRDRRNLSDADIRRWIEATYKAIDSKARAKIGGEAGGRGRENSLASNEAKQPERQQRKSAAQVAEAMGINRTKVERAVYVNRHGDEETKAAVDRGEMTINAAATKIREEKKKAKEEEGQGSPPRKREPKMKFAPSEGLSRCEAAIANMECINKNDTEREAAWARMRQWLNENE